MATGAVALAKLPIRRAYGGSVDDGFIDVRLLPDAVTVVTEDASVDAKKSAADRWDANGTVVLTVPTPDCLRVSIASPRAAVKAIRLSWNGSTTTWKSVLGDHW